MSYTFRMILGGLCSFVPTPDRKEVRALMVNTDPHAAHGRVGTLIASGHMPELHTPTLIYDRLDEAGADPALGSRRAIWPLDNEEITVLVPQPSPLQIKGPLTGGKKDKPINGDRDLDWIPKLKDLLPGAGAIEADCLAFNPKKEFLKARVRVDHGTLKVDQFATFNSPDEVLTEFVPLPHGAKIARQALPHRVAWEFEVPDGEKVTIQARPFSGPTSTPIITFLPAAGKTAIEVLLVNLCCGSYLNTEKAPSRLEPDNDFECFYMLLDNFDSLVQQVKPLPIPVAVQYQPASAGSAVAGTVTGIRCSMSRADAQ